MVTVSLPELAPHLWLGGMSRVLPESLGFGCFQLKIFTCQRDTCWWQVLFPYNFSVLSLYMKDKLTAYPVNEGMNEQGGSFLIIGACAFFLSLSLPNPSSPVAQFALRKSMSYCNGISVMVLDGRNKTMSKPRLFLEGKLNLSGVNKNTNKI